MIKVGLRVVRGPNWSLGNEDGGEGYTGTLYHVNIQEKTAIVQWDNGNQTLCKIGLMNKFELRILDNAQAGVTHRNIYCNLCHNIKGTRFICNTCINCDLCENCYNKRRHISNHSFKKIKSPNTVGFNLPPERNNKSGVLHRSITCDECHSEVYGIRYKCGICFNFDLCNFCYRTNKHNLNHIFTRIDIPNSKGINLPPRSNFNYITFHQNVRCDVCDVSNICGTRYKCNNCWNYDLCELCYRGNKHNLDHSFKRIVIPKSSGFNLAPRSSCEINEIIHNGINCNACSLVNLRDVRYKCDNCSNYDLCEFCYYGNEHDMRHSFIKIDFPGCLGILLPPRATTGNDIKNMVHQGVHCVECPSSEVSGIRYICSNCNYINLCHICYHEGMHDLTHSFTRIDEPHSLGIELPPRIISRKCELRGIFKGAKVMQGIDWDCQNQNISQDQTGVVLDIRDWTEGQTWRSAAYVMWHQGNKQLCRLGYNGHCDVQFVKAAPGTTRHYYPDHLPILGQTEEQMQFNNFLNTLENRGDEQTSADCHLQELCNFEQLSLSELEGNCELLSTASGSSSNRNLNNITCNERVKELENKIIKMEESLTCVICLVEKRNVVFLCGHGSCSNCADNLQFCQMCRKPIEKKIRIF